MYMTLYVLIGNFRIPLCPYSDLLLYRSTFVSRCASLIKGASVMYLYNVNLIPFLIGFGVMFSPTFGWFWVWCLSSEFVCLFALSSAWCSWFLLWLVKQLVSIYLAVLVPWQFLHLISWITFASYQWDTSSIQHYGSSKTISNVASESHWLQTPCPTSCPPKWTPN